MGAGKRPASHHRPSLGLGTGAGSGRGARVVVVFCFFLFSSFLSSPPLVGSHTGFPSTHLCLWDFFKSGVFLGFSWCSFSGYTYLVFALARSSVAFEWSTSITFSLYFGSLSDLQRSQPTSGVFSYDSLRENVGSTTSSKIGPVSTMVGTFFLTGGTSLSGLQYYFPL